MSLDPWRPTLITHSSVAFENIGETETGVMFIELKDSGSVHADTGALGPQ